ncbi:MAG: trigger factor [bacterium]
MNVSPPTREGILVKFRVELDAEEIKPHIEKAFKKAQNEAKLDGFRKGKVPLSVIEKRFGASIKAEAAEDIIQSVYPEAIEQAKVEPVAPGSVEDVEYDPDKHLKFTAVVEVEPEFKADKWKDLAVEKEVPLVSDDDVERHLAGMRRERAIISERPADEGAEMNDRITADLQELDEGGLPMIGHRHEDAAFELGQETLGHGSDELLVGLVTGESRKVKTHRHVHDESGKEATQDVMWQVNVKKVEKIELPELDDSFAQSVDEKFATMQALRDDARQQLENYAKYQADQRLEGRMVDAIVNAHEFDVPPSLVEDTINRLYEEQPEHVRKGVKAETLREQLKPYAERQLRWYFLRNQLISDLQLEATDEDIDKHIEEYAQRTEGANIKDLKLMFGGGDNRQRLADEIVGRKLIDALKEGVKLKEKKVDFVQVLR